MTLQQAEFAVPDTDPVWNDGNWWWWDGAEWLLGTSSGWQRLEDVYGIAQSAALPEPLDAIDPVAIAPRHAESSVPPAIETPAAKSGTTSPAQTIQPRPGHNRRTSPLMRRFLMAVLVLAAAAGGGFLWHARSHDSTKPPAGPTEVAGNIATLGANLADWSVTHPLASGYPAGSAFVPSASLPTVAGKPGARYTEVTTTNGLITSFRLNLPPNSTLGTARFALLRDLPPDATLLDTRPLGTCEIAHYTSLILGETVSETNPSGSVVVVFRSPTVTFDSGNLALADVAATSNIPDRC